MAINNLEQKRLLYAMRESDGKDKDYGNMVKKVPAYIYKNGFPYAMAFLKGEKNGEPIFETIYKWHTNKGENTLCLLPEVNTKNEFIETILTAKGEVVRALTLETFSLMKSLRRFAKSDSNE